MTKAKSTSIIQVRNLLKIYGSAHAIKGLTFEVGNGQVVGFLGPNGAGKSTTIKILTGYLQPTSGTVKILDIDVVRHSIEVRRHIGYLPENNPLYEEMMVMEYLEFVAQMRQIPKSKRRTMIDKAIHACGLEPALSKDIGVLSKGYCQRVGLAQAIVHDPQLLILDEPTSGLDPNQIIEIRSLIKKLGEEKTVLMSTHILSEAQSTCSRILIINDGKLVADDTPLQLTKQEGGSIYVVVASAQKKRLLKEEVFEQLSGIFGVSRVESVNEYQDTGVAVIVNYDKEDPRTDIFQKIVGLDWILLEMRRKEITLEETFRRLTKE
jgi:ABC-2 type transport system ATP-binding protein